MTNTSVYACANNHSSSAAVALQPSPGRQAGFLLSFPVHSSGCLRRDQRQRGLERTACLDSQRATSTVLRLSAEAGGASRAGSRASPMHMPHERRGDAEQPQDTAPRGPAHGRYTMLCPRSPQAAAFHHVAWRLLTRKSGGADGVNRTALVVLPASAPHEPTRSDSGSAACPAHTCTVALIGIHLFAPSSTIALALLSSACFARDVAHRARCGWPRGHCAVPAFPHIGA